MSFLDKLKAKLNPPGDDPDERLRQVLLDNGDDGTKKRNVDHLAYFNSQHDAAAYMTFVQELGFTLQKSDEEFGVGFQKESAVVGEDFERELATLRAKAIDLNGEYDGWGCSVVQ